MYLHRSHGVGIHRYRDGDAMITIKHNRDGKTYVDVSWGIQDAIIGEYTHHQARYFAGLEEPNYPMPATIDNAETAGNWLSLSSCPWPNPPCRACIEKWEDQMLYDFPFLD